MSDQAPAQDEPIGIFAWVTLAFLALVQIGVIIMPMVGL